MKSLDIFRSAQLPVPADDVDKLLAQHGNRLYPRPPATDPCFSGLDCSADGRTLIGFGDEFVLLWDSEHSEPQKRLRLPGKITCAAINGSGSFAIVGTAAGSLFLLSIPDLEVLEERKGQAAIHTVQVSDTGIAVFCDVDGHVAAFDTRNNGDLPKIHYVGAAARLWLSRDAKHLVIDDRRTVILCHPLEGWVESAFRFGFEPGEMPALSAGGWVVATRHRQVHIWNRDSANHAMILDHPARIGAFDMTSSMGTIAVITAAQKLYLHTPRNNGTGAAAEAAQTYVREPHSLKLRHNGVFLCGRERSALLASRDNVPVRTYIDRLIPIVSAQVSPDERFITIGDQAGGITVYDAVEGHRKRERVEFSEAGAISVVDASHADRIVVAGGHDGKLRVIRYADTGDTNDIGSIDGGGGRVQAACLLGTQVCFGNDAGLVTRVDIETGEPVQRYAGHSGLVRSIVQHRDLLITTDQSGVICVFDYATAALLQRFQIDDTAYRVCLDEVGTRLYAGTRSGAIACWDLMSGELVDEFALNRSVPRSMHIRGTLMLSLGLCGDLRLYDLADKKLKMSVDIPGPSWQRYGYLNSSGTRAMTCGADGVMRFFCTTTGIERACGLHAPKGFLWFGNDSEGEKPEWLWTDQDDALDVVIERGDAAEVLPRDSAERQAFLLERNSKRTMAQVGLFPGLDERETKGATLDTPLITRRLTGPDG